MDEWINPDYADVMARMKSRRQEEDDQEAEQAPRRFFLIPEFD